MIKEIKKYPEPILRQKSEEVKEITPEIKKLAEDMIETLVRHKPEGLGLAAPQIGELKRLIIVQTEKEPMTFINPKVLKKSRKQEVMEEGCLSFPGIWLKIKRAKEIELEAIDLDGKKVKIKAGGLFARILEHEIDHLDGILFIDKIGFFQRLKIKRKFKALSQ